MLHHFGRRRPFLFAAVLGAVVTFGFVAATAATATAAPAGPRSQFVVVEGSIRQATGVPRPADGTHASLWSIRSAATTSVEGAGRVLVGAIGDRCDGWPRIELSVDGRVVGTSRIVSPRQYGTYPIGPALAAGRHDVRIRYVNDHRTQSCDRNVHVGYVRMERALPADPQAVPAPTPTSKPKPPPGATPTPPPAKPTPPPAAPSQPVAPPEEETEGPTEAPEAPVTPGPTVSPPAARGDSAPPQSTVRPGPSSTGVPRGTVLRRHQGDLVVSQDGAVIDGLEIFGHLDIRADNVTVRNTLVRGRDPGTKIKALVSAYGDHRNFVIEDSTLRSDFTTPYMSAGIKGHHFTATRLNVSNVVDNVLVFGNDVVIEDSWFHDTTTFSPWPRQPDNQTHSDNLEIVGGSNILVRGNLFEGASNVAIMITQDVARSSNIRVVDNWLMVGDCIVNIADKRKGPVQSSFIGNRFGVSRNDNCPFVASVGSEPVNENNVWIDRPGDPVVVRRAT